MIWFLIALAEPTTANPPINPNPWPAADALRRCVDGEVVRRVNARRNHRRAESAAKIARDSVVDCKWSMDAAYVEQSLASSQVYEIRSKADERAFQARMAQQRVRFDHEQVARARTRARELMRTTPDKIED